MTLAHDVSGAGPTVLLVHSTATDRRMWDPQVPVLAAAGYRVVRGDLRGYGESPVATSPFSHSDDVLALVDGRFAMIGSSGGGWVAQEIAARCPDRVTALALLCTAAPGHEPSPRLRAFSDNEDALLAAGDLDAAADLNADLWLGPEAGDEARAAVRTMQRHAFAVQRATPEPDEIEYDWRAENITAPTLLVSGAHDLPDFTAIAERLATAIPGARHLPLSWAGHLPGMERPDLLNPILTDFLAAHHPPAGP